MKINQKRVNTIANDLQEKYLWKFISEYHVIGEENLEKIQGEQTLYLSNHVSHFDYIIIPKILNDNSLPHPGVIAGKNLNRWPTNKLLNEDTGATFINRKIMKSKKITDKKKREIKNMNEKLESLVVNNHGLIVFPEGTRNHNLEIMQEINLGSARRYLNFADKHNKKIKGINMAIYYSPKTIESTCIHVAKFFKEKIESIYFAIDIYSYIKQYLSKKDGPKVFINIGKPYEINKENIKELDDFIREDTRILHKQIS